MLYKLAVAYLYYILEHNWILCLDLCPIPKVSYYVNKSIPKSEKKIERFLVSNILDKKRYSSVIMFQNMVSVILNKLMYYY